MKVRAFHWCGDRIPNSAAQVSIASGGRAPDGSANSQLTLASVVLDNSNLGTSPGPHESIVQLPAHQFPPTNFDPCEHCTQLAVPQHLQVPAMASQDSFNSQRLMVSPLDVTCK
jgi:hypothetical protein